jgi:hypothetical protein
VQHQLSGKAISKLLPEGILAAENFIIYKKE